MCVCGAESSLQWQWSVRGNRLELGPLTLSHAGRYTCLAKNSDGEAQRDYTLTVQGNTVLLQGRESNNKCACHSGWPVEFQVCHVVFIG